MVAFFENVDPCKLFNAKSCLYIYSKYMWFEFFVLFFRLCVCVCVCKSNLYIYIKYTNFIGTIYQPLRSGRIWHKVNF